MGRALCLALLLEHASYWSVLSSAHPVPGLEMCYYYYYQGSYLRLDLLEWWRNRHFPEMFWGSVFFKGLGFSLFVAT
jgi:hypothetical protein